MPRVRIDVCLGCGRIVRREYHPDGNCPRCGGTEFKFENIYEEI